MGIPQLDPRDTFTLEAAADLRGYRYRALVYVATEKTNLASGDGSSSEVCGVLQNKPNTGQGATVADGGISPMYAGAAITAGVIVTHDSTGYAVTVGSGDMALGRALTAAGAAGDQITVRLFRPFRWSGAA